MLLVGFGAPLQSFALRAIQMRLSDYVQIKEAAALLGVAENTLRNWERSGKIRVYRHPINNYRLYKRADIAALLAAIESPPSPIQNLAKDGL
jgi:MerR family transcriptional regulator, copper efflux regulator